jgi:uncharacterized membrane protein YeiH
MLKSDIYATAALCGGTPVVFLGWISMSDGLRMACTTTATFAPRAAAMKHGLRLPKFKSMQDFSSQLARKRRTGGGSSRYP